MSGSMIEVLFKVFADLNFGEEVFLSGNVPGLGCDDTTRAIPLVTTSAEFPWWRTKEGIFVPAEPGAVKYRYCIFCGGKFNRWEGDFRVLDVAQDKSLVKTTEDKFGVISSDEFLNVTSPQKQTVITKDEHSHRAKLFAAWNRSRPIERSLDSSDSVIMVSYFLPVNLSKKSTGAWVASWDREALLSALNSATLQVSRVVWVGSVRYGNQPIPPEEEENVAAVLSELNCIPIFINQTMHYKFYEKFCKNSLWLVLHHVADVYGPLQGSDKSLKAEQDLWFNYSQVHKFFRDKILEIYQPGYLIWIHGLHLMLLPNFLRRRLPQAKIGYFFHTPFPSSEIWRTMSRREDLLRGLLGADQIGFHLYEYARHFLTACHRLLGYTHEMNSNGLMSVNVDGRQVSIACIHVGVDLIRLQEEFASPSFKTDLSVWKDKFANKILISGVDRLERLKAIPLRLMAIDRFLEENPKWIGKVVFALIGISAGERGTDYKQTVHDVKILAQRINEKYVTITNYVVYFEERSEKDFRLSQRLPYFAASDVLLMAATRDGLNRYPMEFALAREQHGNLVKQGFIAKSERLEGAGQPNEGLIIISEFISSARVMRGAIVVNPWRVDELTSSLNQVLTMGDEERAERSRRNMEFSARVTSGSWAKYVLSDLKSTEVLADPASTYAVGFGLQYKIMNLKAGFQLLDSKEIAKAFRTSHYRLILLDWGGTLVPNLDKHDKLHAFAVATGHATQEGPSQELTQVLEQLCADPKSIVFVVSGKEIHAVGKYFGNVKGLGLGAEHGLYYKWPREEHTHAHVHSHHSLASRPQSIRIDDGSSNASSDHPVKWQSVVHIADNSWKESAKIVMDIYVQRTHGTYIEQKGNALIWQFSDADPEFGFLQSKELEDHLHSILSAYPVEVIRGGGVSDGYIEVRPAGANKGLFLEHAVNVMKAHNMDPDFILAVGDDISDEPMFERVGQLLQDQPDLGAFSVTVGKKPTAAKAYVDDSSAVLELLNLLVKSLQRDKKFLSMADIPTHLGGLTNDLNQMASSFRASEPGPTNRPMLRSNSDGALTTSTLDPPQLHGMTRRPGTSDSKSDLSAQTYRHSLSLSMKDYMSSLSEDHHDEDMGGISF